MDVPISGVVLYTQNMFGTTRSVRITVDVRISGVFDREDFFYIQIFIHTLKYTIGGMFLQKLVLCKDGPVKHGNNTWLKTCKKTTLVQKDGRKEDKKLRT